MPVLTTGNPPPGWPAALLSCTTFPWPCPPFYVEHGVGIVSAIPLAGSVAVLAVPAPSFL